MTNQSAEKPSGQPLGIPMTDLLGLVERLRTDVLWHKRRGNETMARDCQEAADEIERLRTEIDRLQPMEMALCERHSLVLRVGATYVFRPIGDCPSCAAMVARARDAYGPGLGA